MLALLALQMCRHHNEAVYQPSELEITALPKCRVISDVSKISKHIAKLAYTRAIYPQNTETKLISTIFQTLFKLMSCNRALL